MTQLHSESRPGGQKGEAHIAIDRRCPRRLVLGLSLCVGAVACAAPYQATAPAKAESAPTNQVPPATIEKVEAVTPSPTIVAWGVRYQRRCRGNRGDAFVSHRGDLLAYCGDLFAADTGKYQSEAPTGFTGTMFAGVDPGDPITIDKAKSKLIEELSDAVVSPDGSKLIGVKTVASPDNGKFTSQTMDTVYEASLIDRATSTVVQSARWSGDDPPELGFLSDGAPYVFTRQPCHSRMTALESSVTRCAKSAVYRLEKNALVHGPHVFDESTSVAINASGTVAMVADPKGAVRLVNPVDGSIIMDAPFIALKNPKARMAVSSDGQRIAWQSPIGIEIFVRAGNQGTIVYSGAHETSVNQLRFSNDGRSLFANDDQFVEALGEGVFAKPTTPDPIVIALPKGFTLDNSFEDNSLGETELRLGEWSSARGHFALYRSDADEFDTKSNLEAWSQKVADRYGLGKEAHERHPSKKHSAGVVVHSWETPDGRNIAFETHADSDCDPHDRYYLMAQRGSFLYRASLAVRMRDRPSKKTLQSWFEALFELPMSTRYERAEHPASLPKATGCQ